MSKPQIDEDVEKSSSQPRHGFPAVAAFVASDPDHETYIFRKFNTLTARNLIHLQSEILDLQQQLQEYDEKAQSGNDSRFMLSLRHWEILKTCARDRDGDERKLKALADEIAVKLDKYQQALLQAAAVMRLEAPNPRALSIYKSQFDQMNIRGNSAGLLDEKEDLVALRAPADRDFLSRLTRENWPFPSIAGEGQVGYFRERHLRTFVAAMSVMIAGILLIGSILTLYFVQHPDARLGLLLSFILLFAVSMRISTTATRDSIFAATAAYAAVLIVFVSGDLGKANQT